MADRERERVRPSFEILVNGTKLEPEAETDAFQIEVTTGMNEIGMFALSLNAGDPKSGGIKWIDGDTFQEGSEITVKLGFHAPLTEMIVGEITALEPEFAAEGPVVFTVRGYDRMYRLGFGKRVRSFREMKDSDIAAQVAHDWNLRAEVEDTHVIYEYVLQNEQSDLEFLLQRARRIGYELAVRGRSLIFRRPPRETSPVTTLTYGRNLISFSPRLSLLGQASGVVVQGWAREAKDEISAEAVAGDESTTMGGNETGAAAVGRVLGTVVEAEVLEREVPQSPEEAEALAKGRLDEVAFARVQGDGICLGEPAIQAGAVIELAELGQRFSGRYYITTASHSLSSRGGYLTHFSLVRSAS